jgi:TonB family protein
MLIVSDKNSEQEITKPAKAVLPMSANAVLSTPSPTERRGNFLKHAAVISVFFHLAMLLLLSPQIEKFIKETTEAKALEAALVFKPVVLTFADSEKKPDKANYYAEHDQKTKKEQSSRHKSLNQEAISKKALNAQKEEAKPQQEQRKRITVKAPQAKDFIGKPNEIDPLGLKNIPAAQKARPEARPFGEHLPGVAEGDETELNAWVWRHAPFFNRIKARIGQTWAPNMQIARHDPQGSLLGQKDRVTVMSVTIDGQGKLKHLAVANSSGIAYLDEEAERAFKKAAPFLYPPKDLFKNKQDFTFQFAFHLQVNRGLKFDFEWSTN